MATFTTFSDLLPDPNNKINNAGAADTSGTAGPGFAKIKFASNNQTQVSRTISGRGVTASPSYHNWAFDISYNPMTRDEFDPVASFLESRRGRLNPFYVILPQHAAPKNAAFANYCASNTITTNWQYTTTGAFVTAGIATIQFATQTAAPFKAGDSITVSGVTPIAYNGTFTVTSGTANSVSYVSAATGTQTVAGTVRLAVTKAGSPTIMLGGFSATSGSPSPGDFFTITDPSDANHLKTYKVLRVEDSTTYQVGTTAPSSTQRRIWTQPPMSRDVSSGAVINFINPKFRVIQKGDTMEYDLDTDNLYQFSLSLEEIQP